MRFEARFNLITHGRERRNLLRLRVVGKATARGTSTWKL